MNHSEKEVLRVVFLVCLGMTGLAALFVLASMIYQVKFRTGYSIILPIFTIGFLASLNIFPYANYKASAKKYSKNQRNDY